MEWERGMERIALWKKAGKPIYLTSGGFDPIHVGHVRCLLHSALLAEKDGGKLVVLVNCDGFLTRKKGKPFMSEMERMEIIQSIKGVDLALVWESDEQTVIEAIRRIKPDFFTKGGDRISEETIPEWDVCQQVGCKVLTGIGGDKIQSSSWLLNARL
jgi:D-beta-D-heptose 7-phosphate kinase/D-beta-D-heptose 1-phosphate adenosyltransferase